MIEVLPEGIDLTHSGSAPFIDYTKGNPVCICKGCPNIKVCLEHFDDRGNYEDDTYSPQDFTCECWNSNISSTHTNSSIKRTFMSHFLESLVGYFTKRDKKDTQRDKSNDDVIDSNKGDKQRDCKDKKGSG